MEDRSWNEEDYPPEPEDRGWEEYDIVEKFHEVAENSPGYEELEVDQLSAIIRRGPILAIQRDWLNTFSLLEAHFLGQLDYFIRKKDSKKDKKGLREDGMYWIYETYNQWLEMFPCVSKSTLIRAINRLENAKIVLGRQRKWDKEYTINYQMLAYYLAHPKEYRDI